VQEHINPFDLWDSGQQEMIFLHSWYLRMIGTGRMCNFIISLSCTRREWYELYELVREGISGYFRLLFRITPFHNCYSKG